VALLNKPEKQFFTLRYEQGLSQQEVARQLGITRRNVRTKENKLRQRLKKHLKNNI